MLLFDIFTPSSIFWLLFHTHNFLIRLWRWKLREAYKYMKEWKWQKATFLQMYRKWKIYILKLLPKNLNYELFSFYWQLQFLHISHFTFQIIFSFPQWHILSWVLVLQPKKKFLTHPNYYNQGDVWNPDFLHCVFFESSSVKIALTVRTYL